MSDGIDGKNALRFAYRGGTSSRSLPQTPNGKASKSCGIWLGRVSESRVSMAVRSVSYFGCHLLPEPASPDEVFANVSSPARDLRIAAISFSRST